MEAKRALSQQHFTQFNSPVSVAYKFGAPDKKRRDIDNLFKGPNDLLVSVGAIVDDSLIHRISGEWADIQGCEVSISEF